MVMDNKRRQTYRKEVDEAFLITANYLIALVASVADELYFLANSLGHSYCFRNDNIRSSNLSSSCTGGK